MSATRVRRGSTGRAPPRKGSSRVSVPRKLASKLPMKQAEANRLAGWMFGLFVLLVVVMDYAFTRTKWGRSLFAVGGNREAARRAGIDVRGIYMSAFVLCSTFAALGGLIMQKVLVAVEDPETVTEDTPLPTRLVLRASTRDA